VENGDPGMVVHTPPCLGSAPFSRPGTDIEETSMFEKFEDLKIELLPERTTMGAVLIGNGNGNGNGNTAFALISAANGNGNGNLNGNGNFVFSFA